MDTVEPYLTGPDRWSRVPRIVLFILAPFIGLLYILVFPAFSVLSFIFTGGFSAIHAREARRKIRTVRPAHSSRRV